MAIALGIGGLPENMMHVVECEKYSLAYWHLVIGE